MKTEKLLTAAGASALMMSYGQKDDNDVTELVASIKSVTETVKKNNDQFKEDLEKLKKDFGSNTAGYEQFKSDVDEKLKKNAEDFRDLQAKLDEIAQKASRAGAGRPEPKKSLGQHIVQHEDFKKFTGAKGETVRISIDSDIRYKAVTGLDASAGHLVEPTNAGVVVPARRRMTIRGLLAQAQTNSDSVKFVRQVFTNNAAPQAGEGAAKAESDMSFTPHTADVITVAHWIKVSRQILSNAPALQGMIDTSLRYGLAYREEMQLLTGAGTTNNLTGLVTGATAFARPAGLGQRSNVTPIDILRVAALQGTVAEYFVDGYVMNPVNWTLIEMEKDSTGRYIIGDPTADGPASLWGTPVVATNAMSAGSFLAGAFGQAAQIFDRETADVMMSSEDGDNFTKNMVTILAELALTLAIYVPQALVTGTFAGAKAALEAP